MGEEKAKGAGVWTTVKPFVNCGASGMLATCVIQPVDMIKVRIQLGQGSGLHVAKTMLREEGFGAFYKGLSAGLLRQATYRTARLGSYRILTNKAVAANDGKPLPLYQTALCLLTAGAIGASVGSPADLALIRMQADATLPAAQRRNYTNAFHALYRITADEGVLALWKGAGPTVVRDMAFTMGLLASYDQSVEFFKDTLGFSAGASTLVAGAIGASVGSPADLALIRMQADATLPAAQRRNYTNAFHALYRITADEGVLALWKGAGPTVVRDMAFTMGLLASYDQSVEFFKDTLGFSAGASTLVGAIAVSGFFATACSLPFDYVKTQIQKMQPDASGKYPYTGSLDCAMKTLKAGGPFKFYAGFPVYCVRIAPHLMMTWIFFNLIRKLEKRAGL